MAIQSPPHTTVNQNLPQQLPDTVEIDGKKKGLSNGQKWGIGLGIAAALSATVLLLRGKTSAAQEEIVNFKPAKTIEEAKKFAKEKLGIYINDKDNFTLDVLNYTNEGILELKNKSPKDFKISWLESKNIGGGYASDGIAQFVTIDEKNVYGINLNKEYIKNINNTLTEFIEREVERQALVSVNGKLKYNDFFQKASISNETTELINRFRENPADMTFKEKVKLHLALGDIGDTMDRLFLEYNGDISKIKETVQVISNPFHPIIHEQGHILHRINISKEKFDLLDQIEVLNQKELSTSTYNDFMQKHSKTAAKVSEYAMSSPAEFVAEIYAKSLSGVKFDEDVLNLYKKYGGPAI